MSTTDLNQKLAKAMEAGSYNAAPSTLTQGAALQVEDLSPVMQVVTFGDKDIKLQKMLEVDPVKSTTVQYDRQLDYGGYKGQAQLEGLIGPSLTSDYVRIVVSMCYYSHARQISLASMMVDTVDSKKNDERAAEDGAKAIAGAIELDLFRGWDDFSNAGVFDGSPLALPYQLAGIQGLNLQIRQSDSQINTQDLFFAEFGGDTSCVIQGGSTLSQDMVEDAGVRSNMNHGTADRLMVDPIVKANYNKITYGKERIYLPGATAQATGAELNKQHTASGEISVESCRFLSGKTSPARPTMTTGAPLPPVSISPASTTVSGVVTPFLAGEVYTYYATSENEVGESPRCTPVPVTISASGDEVQATITHPGSGVVRFFNVYRTPANGATATAKFIGRVKIAASGSTTVFYDLGNKTPGFVTGTLVQGDTMAIKELAPYTRVRLAQADLSQTEGHLRFCTLAVMQPRKNVIIDNLS